ncbi:MAG: murein tripeptide amidase MpaA [Pseudohongiellaceae bacterium]
MQISQDFDGGNIEVVTATDTGNIQLKIRHDNQSEFYQWFYFRLSGAKREPCTLNIVNARGAAYPPGFENYNIVYSYDRVNWLRHPTSLQDGILTLQFTPEHDSVFFAYFAPYSMERHLDLVSASQLAPHCQHKVLGKSLDGQDIDLVVFSDGREDKKKKTCWVIARQHPGETMAEWWMEGCIEKLLDVSDPLTAKLLQQCDIYLVPNMNPDGSRRGHLRTNAAGKNLNREWIEPTLSASPEVYLVKEAIKAIGADFFLDAHGDESLPYCFIAGTEGLADWGPAQQARLDFYKNRLAEIDPDFQTKVGYPAKSPGTANLSMSTAQVASLTGCLAMTLEMPFKDTTATPDPITGWSPARCKTLAHSCLQTLDEYIDSGLL